MRLVSEATACGLIAFSTEQGNRSPESTAAVTCYRHTTALLKLGPGHSPGVRRAEPLQGQGGIGSSCWECRPGLSAPRLPRLTSHTHFLRQLHLMTNRKGPPSFRAPCRVGRGVPWDCRAAKALPRPSLTSFPSLPGLLILRVLPTDFPPPSHPLQICSPGTPCT